VLQQEKDYINMENEQKLRDALALALADMDFMGNNKKVAKAIEALTPKDTVTSVFKRLQGNARKDFLDNLDAGKPGFTVENRDAKIKQYVHDKFKSYMDDLKTSAKATELFNATYQSTSAPGDQMYEAVNNQ
jgi:hypothetical protein